MTKTARLKDLTISYYDAGESDDTVLLIHGWAGSKSYFKEVVDVLKRDFRVIAPDLPGHGDSSKVETPTIDLYTEIVKDLVGELNLEKFHLIGYSLGGVIGFNYIYNFPEDIKRLVIWASGSKFDDIFQFRLYRKIIKNIGSWKTFTELVQRIVEKNPLGLWDDREAESFTSADVETLARLMLELSLVDYRERLPEIVNDTLLVTGEKEDVHLSFQKFRNMDKLLPNSKLVHVPGGSHYDKTLIPAAKEIGRFLASKRVKP